MPDTTATAHQLYPTIRTDAMTIDRLNAVLRMALADMAETNHTCIYTGMNRADTIATARRTVADVTAHLNYRAAMAFDRQATLDLLHVEAAAEYASELNRRAVITYAGAPSATATAANILREIRGE